MNKAKGQRQMKMDYGKFPAMMRLSFIIMYAVMFVNMDRLAWCEINYFEYITQAAAAAAVI